MYEGASGRPANANDCSSYAEAIGNPSFPVMADEFEDAVGVTPITLRAHPEMCALAPDMTILGCYTGHGAYEDALNEIREHADI